MLVGRSPYRFCYFCERTILESESRWLFVAKAFGGERCACTDCVPRRPVSRYVDADVWTEVGLIKPKPGEEQKP